MVRVKGGVPSKRSDITTYNGREDVERAYYAANRGRQYDFKRSRDASWVESYNNATALYRCILDIEKYNYDSILTKNGTSYDEYIEDFKEKELIFDSKFNEVGFSVGKNHAIRIIRLKEKEIKLEYLDDFVDSDIISEFQEYLNNSKNNGIGGR